MGAARPRLLDAKPLAGADALAVGKPVQASERGRSLSVALPDAGERLAPPHQMRPAPAMMATTRGGVPKLLTLRARGVAELGPGERLRLVVGLQQLLHLVTLALRNADRRPLDAGGRAVAHIHRIQFL